MKIGLLSDTHSFLDERIKQHFEMCDEVWHAGDIGHADVLHQLRAFKPVRAVYGNIDDRELTTCLPEDLWFEVDGLTVWMTHIAGSPPHYNARVKTILRQRQPDLLVAGHSHILKVMRDPVRGFLFVNPGAAGHHGFHRIKTVVRFEITRGQIKNMEAIELGKRGEVPPATRQQ
ncbi:MAG: metallophosphatase family protein [Cyclobacteriaceae bacterium]|jgi:hypothetical protein|nr:metallophosphatase family protein [Cyclobacteriaceae bacterium]